MSEMTERVSNAVITEICAEIKNYFVRNASHKIVGTFHLSQGVLTLCEDAEGMTAEAFDALMEEGAEKGRYLRLIGSLYSDGVVSLPMEGPEETFTGEVWLMSPPPDFLALAKEIDAWTEKYGESVSVPYASESFEGYSYTLRGTSRWRDNDSTTATDFGWQCAFRRRLNKYRRILV